MKEGNDMLKKIMAAALSALTVMSLCAVTVSADRKNSGWTFEINRDVGHTGYRPKDNTSSIYIRVDTGYSLYVNPYGRNGSGAEVPCGLQQYAPIGSATHVINSVKEDGYSEAALKLYRVGGRQECTGVWSPDSGQF